MSLIIEQILGREYDLCKTVKFSFPNVLCVISIIEGVLSKQFSEL